MKIYHAYDILGVKFYLSLYDESGKLFRSDGYAFSGNIYSINTDRDSLIMLKNDNKYSSIVDLYITVSNPPHTSTATKVIINNKLSKDIAFLDNNNTMRINNAFPKKGAYDIVVDGVFVDKSNMMTSSVTLKIKIMKE